MEHKDKPREVLPDHIKKSICSHSRKVQIKLRYLELFLDSKLTWNPQTQLKKQELDRRYEFLGLFLGIIVKTDITEQSHYIQDNNKTYLPLQTKD